MPARRAIFAEFVGTFALMFVGGGAIIVTGGENLLAIALAHGLILGVMVSATMHISGGQINPAVSIALWVIRKQSSLQTGLFMGAQLAGAIAAAAVLRGVYDVDSVKLGATLGTLNDDGNVLGVIVLETIGTFFLMFVIMGTAVDDRGVGKTKAVGGFGIGLTVAAVILCIGPATGASLNPARSFGPALIGNVWDDQGLYWLAPIIGAVLAALAYRAAFGTAARQD